MNEDAGRGTWLIVMIKSQDGEQLPFVIDTGSAITVFDRSLEPKLGKPTGASTLWKFGKPQATSIYTAPRLFVGDKVLKITDAGVCTYDCKSLAASSGHAVMGILGMDAMTNYCLQLDFQAGTVRLSDELSASDKDLGQAFDLSNIGDGRFAIEGNLAGTKDSRSLIDTGFNGDGWLFPKVFETWTNQAVLPANGEVRSPKGILAGAIYNELHLDDLGKLDEGSIQNDQHGDLNGIGLNVLAQNLVTFDFPRRKMYLKRTSDWRLLKKNNEETAKKTGDSAAEFLKKLNQSDRLPGWTKSEEGGATAYHSEDRPFETITVDSKKTGDLDVYHYLLARPLGSDDNSWKLMKAWKTDKNDQKIEEYTIP